MKYAITFFVTLSYLVQQGSDLQGEVPPVSGRDSSYHQQHSEEAERGSRDSSTEVRQEQVIPECKADILVVYGAEWCGPCRKMKPLWKKLKKEGYKIYYVDIDRPDKKIPEKYRKHRPRSVPFLVFWRSDEGPFKTHTGTITEKQVKEYLWKK